MIQFILEHQEVILGLLLATSEALSMIPSVKANGVFQLVLGWMKKQKKPE